jgi:hypothetical protein
MRVEKKCACGKTYFPRQADFEYLIKGEAIKTVEDVKGFKTAMYKLKKKIIEADFGFKILET